MSMIDDPFVSSLPDEPFSALKAVSEAFFSFYGEISAKPADDQDSTDDLNTGCLEYYGLARAIIEENNLKIETNLPTISYDDSGTITNVRDFFMGLGREVNAQHKFFILDKSINKYKNIISTGFKYEFSEKEINRIQTLINELRDLISEHTGFSEEHRLRLLSRLEKLQAEIHKTVSDLDRLWGLIGDAGVVFRKLGEDAKPIVDRIREIAEITWKAQKKAEGIDDESNLPLLE